MLKYIGAAAAAIVALFALQSESKAETKPTAPGPFPGFPPVPTPGGGFPPIPVPGVPGLPPVPGLPTAPPPTVPGLPTQSKPGDCLLDSSIPPEIAATVNTMLKNASVGPAELEQAAVLLQMNGFPLAAGCLRARAKELGVGSALKVVASGPGTHTIRPGDIPVQLAKFYSGDANRWRELGDANPQILPLRTVNGVTNYAGWRVGAVLKLPTTWTARGTPPTAGFAQQVPPTGGV